MEKEYYVYLKEPFTNKIFHCLKEYGIIIVTIELASLNILVVKSEEGNLERAKKNLSFIDTFSMVPKIKINF